MMECYPQLCCCTVHLSWYLTVVVVGCSPSTGQTLSEHNATLALRAEQGLGLGFRFGLGSGSRSHWFMYVLHICAHLSKRVFILVHAGTLRPLVHGSSHERTLKSLACLQTVCCTLPIFARAHQTTICADTSRIKKNAQI